MSKIKDILCSHSMWHRSTAKYGQNFIVLIFKFKFMVTIKKKMWFNENTVHLNFFEQLDLAIQFKELGACY